MTKNNERPICHRAEDLVAYLYNEATETDAQDFADHAEQCDACRSELAVFRQVHESIVLWRTEALGTFSPVSPAADLASATGSVKLVQHERRLPALQALREFFSVSPLWLRGATAFAALLLCVLALVVISRSWKQPAQVAKNSTEEKIYTATQLHDAVEKAVNEKLSKSEVSSQQSPKVAANQGQVKLPSQQRASRRELASNSVPTRSRGVRGLTRAEREQLAADLLLIPGRDEADLPFVFYEEPRSQMPELGSGVINGRATGTGANTKSPGAN